MTESNKKLKMPKAIFLTTVILSVIIGNLFHNFLPNKWNISYKVMVNQTSKNNLSLVDKKLMDMKIKTNDFDQKFEKYINDIIKDTPKIISKTNSEIFIGLENFEMRSNYLRFNSESIEDIDIKIDVVLEEVNKIVRRAITEKFDYYLNQIIDREIFSKTAELNQLKNNINHIVNIKENLIYSNNEDKEETFLKAIAYNMVFKELQIDDYISQRFKLDGLIDLKTTPNFDTLVSALNIIYERRNQDLNSFIKNFENNNFYYKELVKMKKQLVTDDFLTRLNLEQDFNIQRYLPGDHMNQKPTKLFMISSFLFIGIVFSIIFIFLYLNSAILMKKIKKMQATLLYLK